jgi:CxxC motif-containing protein (DUF1111 family)
MWNREAGLLFISLFLAEGLLMKMPHPVWYAVLGVAVLAPVGVRVLTWPAQRHVAVEPSMAEAGKVLFTHVWTPHDPLCNGGDGLGPVYNADSCVACHRQGGVGGSGGRDNNVTLFVRNVQGAPAMEGVVHRYALCDCQESLTNVDSSLPAITKPSLVSKGFVCGTPQIVPRAAPDGSGVVDVLTLPRGIQLSQRRTPALFGAKWLDEIPDNVLIALERKQRLRWAMAPSTAEDVPVGRARRLAQGRIGRFGWKAQSATLAEFVQAACANELGLGNPGQVQPQPLGKPTYQTVALDLTARQCDEITAFVASLPRPQERMPEEPFPATQAAAGKRLFHEIGCADCHMPDVGYVAGLYSDLLLHRMGDKLEGVGSYNQREQIPDPSPGEGPLADEWRTPPLWGVADSGPYLHDGRAATLEEAIQLHAGQAASASARFKRLTSVDQTHVVAFLKSLRAPQ